MGITPLFSGGKEGKEGRGSPLDQEGSDGSGTPLDQGGNEDRGIVGNGTGIFFKLKMTGKVEEL